MSPSYVETTTAGKPPHVERDRPGAKRSAATRQDENILGKAHRVGTVKILASCPDGCTETLMLAHGFTVGRLDEIIRAGFATAQPDRMRAGDRAFLMSAYPALSLAQDCPA